MPTENEKKFILEMKFNQNSLVGWDREDVEQGYLNKTRNSIVTTGGNSIFVVEVPLTEEEDSAMITIEIPLDERDYKALSVEGMLKGAGRIRRKSNACYFTYKKWSVDQDRLVELETEIGNFEYDTLTLKCDEFLKKNRYQKMIDNEEWVVDFLRGDNGATYFVMAEVEMDEEKVEPSRIPPEVERGIIYTVERNDPRFTNKALSDRGHARDMYLMIFQQELR